MHHKRLQSVVDKFGPEHKSLAYSEKVFILTCKTTLCLLRRLPRNFETFVNGHFRERAREILKACIAYANGQVSVGYYGSGSSSSTVMASGSFRKEMEELNPQLVAAYRNCGALLGDSFEQLDSKRKACHRICRSLDLFGLVALGVLVGRRWVWK